MSKEITKLDTSTGHLVVFQEKAIRRVSNNEEWWFSVVDVCGVLTDSPDASAYWRKLKQRQSAEGSEVVTFCHRLKLEAPDGKQRVTDCANTEGLFRIIQSIPSPKAKPFKRWLAQVGFLHHRMLCMPRNRLCVLRWPFVTACAPACVAGLSRFAP